MVVGVGNIRLGRIAGEVDGIFERTFHEVIAFEGAEIRVDHHEIVAGPVGFDPAIPVDTLDESLEAFVMEVQHDIFVSEFILGEFRDVLYFLDVIESVDHFGGDLFHDILPVLFEFGRNVIAEVVFFDGLFEFEGTIRT